MNSGTCMTRVNACYHGQTGVIFTGASHRAPSKSISYLRATAARGKLTTCLLHPSRNSWAKANLTFSLIDQYDHKTIFILLKIKGISWLHKPFILESLTFNISYIVRHLLSLILVSTIITNETVGKLEYGSVVLIVWVKWSGFGSI